MSFQKEVVGTIAFVLIAIVFIIVFASLKEVAQNTGSEEAEQVADQGISAIHLFVILVLGIPSVGLIIWIFKMLTNASNGFNY